MRLSRPSPTLTADRCLAPTPDWLREVLDQRSASWAPLPGPLDPTTAPRARPVAALHRAADHKETTMAHATSITADTAPIDLPAALSADRAFSRSISAPPPAGRSARRG